MNDSRKSGSDRPDDRHERRLRKFERHVVEEIQLTDTHAARATVRRERLARWRGIATWCGLWLVVALAAVFGRGAWLVDEARLLGIAWEMWSQSSFVLPMLNGESVARAPLMFWMTQAGWTLFGVGEWWPRLLAALAVLASLTILRQLVRLLWSAEHDIAHLAPLALLGSLSIAFAASVTTADAWMLLCVLLAAWGLLLQWRRRDMRGWLLTALGLVLGVLVGGVFVFIYIVPVALLAPLWMQAPRPRWSHWYVDLFKSTVAALIVLMFWLAMAARADGAAYVTRFLAANVLGPQLDIFATQQPWWGYAWMLPLMLLPWSVLPLAWMRLWHIRRERIDAGFGFCLAWLAITVALLSLLPSKQPQYLLPLVPVGVLLACRVLFALELREVHRHTAFAGVEIPLVLLGGVLLMLPYLPRVDGLPEVLWRLRPWWGLGLMAAGIASAWLPLVDTQRRMRDIAIVSALSVVFVSLALGLRFDDTSVRVELAATLAAAQSRAQPIAYVGAYRGELHFTGRLRAPFEIVDVAGVEDWLWYNPGGIVIALADRWVPPEAGLSVREFRFGDARLRLVTAQ